MSEVKLQALTRHEAENILEILPNLQDIWERPKAKELVVLSTIRWGTENSAGQIYLIQTAQDNTPIGIIGYFPTQNHDKALSMRWHGILKEYRGNKYAYKAMCLMVDDIKKKYPGEYAYLCESAPLDRPELIEHFKKISFKEADFKAMDALDNDYEDYPETITLIAPFEAFPIN